MGPLYLLDTTVVLELIRGRSLGKRIDATYGLRTLPERPLICEVSIAELEVLATMNRWGAERRGLLATAVANLVRVRISQPAIHAAYHDLDVASRRHEPGAIRMGKNDLWIAACAKAAGARLLTTDGDFDHLFPDQLDGERIEVGA